MADKGIGALLVLDGAELVGIFSERDYARKLILEGRDCKETAVRDIMSTVPVCISADDTVEHCMALMTQRRMRHFPVMEHERLIGVISIGDVVKQIITEKDFEIQQLESYIRSG